MPLIECYDIGGTKIRGALIEKGKIIRSLWFRTNMNPNELIEQIKEMSKLLRIDIPSKKIAAVSIGVAGPVKNNILTEFPSLRIKKKLDIALKLSKEIKEPIFIINDMKAAVRAELKFGIGKNIKNFYLLTFSTGIGSGLVINGKVVEGFFGEFAHDILQRLKNNHNIHWGCLCGGYGIEKIVKNRLKRDLTANDFFKLKDRKAKKIIKDVRDYNAHGIGNMLNAFSVDRIVIMGSVGLNQFNNIIPSSNKIKKYTINRIPKIVKTKLGDNIGLLGAYVFATEELKK
ncbi:MAG: ROK family protein [Candidatus Aenigmatarchaeota archaeon]